MFLQWEVKVGGDTVDEDPLLSFLLIVADADTISDGGSRHILKAH